MAYQPKLAVARSRAERILQIVAIGAVATLLAFAIRVWPDLPPTVPTHFDIFGVPGGYGSRVLLLVLLATVTLVFLALTLLERVPHWYDYPIEVTAANASRLYALGRQLVLWLKLIVVVAFGFIFRTLVEVAFGEATALPGWFFPAVLGSAATVILVTFVRMRRARVEASG